MAWIYLVAAAICEIGWAFGLKYSDGFTRFGPSVITVITMIVSFVLLSQALKAIPIGTAYAIWTGIGAAGTAILGMVFFQESADIWRIGCLLLIVSGTLGLKLVSQH